MASPCCKQSWLFLEATQVHESTEMILALCIVRSLANLCGVWQDSWMHIKKEIRLLPQIHGYSRCCDS